MIVLVLATLALPLIAALAGWISPRSVARVAPPAAAAALVAGLAAAAGLALGGRVTLAVGNVQLVNADRVTALLLILVCGVSAVSQRYAAGYLRGDARAARFFTGASVLAAGTALMAFAGSLVVFAAAWTISGLALVALLGMYAPYAPARLGVSRTAAAFLAGDLALWGAVVLVWANWGELPIHGLQQASHALRADAAGATVVALALVLAALARSSQVPFQRWLPATLASPTPVSALLHAGVVNAGGILLVRTSPIVGASHTAGIVLVVAGGVTAIYGTTLMLAKSDIKGALAHSTIGQMGFMVMTCGIGAYAAAIFHLVAHGMYKATLFLGSGGAVERRVRHLKSPPAQAPAPGPGAYAVAALAPAALIALIGSAADVGFSGPRGTGALLIFAWGSAAAALVGVASVRAGRRATLRAGFFVLGALAAYLVWLEALTGFLRPDIQAASAAASAWSLAPVFLILAAVAFVRALGGTSIVHRRLYVLALSLGHVKQFRRLKGRKRTARGLTAGPLVAAAQGVRS